MDTYNHILVAVDGSNGSNLALREATRLAKEMQAELQIVHVVDEATLNWDAEFADINEIRRSVRSSAQDILDEAAGVAREAGIEAGTRLMEIEVLGHTVSEMIAQEAAAWPADLIVIGTHGRRGLSHLLLGSVAEGVVRIAAKPILLVRGK